MLVIAIGVVSIPDSRIHSSPVISPLPLSRWQPAKTGSCGVARAARDDDGHAGPDRPAPDDERPVALDERRVPDAHAGDVGDRVERAGLAAPDRDPEVARPHRRMLAGSPRARSTAARSGADAGPPRAYQRRRAYHRPVIPTPRPSAPLRLRRLPDRVAATRAIDAAEAFRDLPGLVLLESARPGRNARWTYLTADPVAVLESPAAGPDPFAVARRLVARLDRTPRRPGRRPPFLGGLVGFLGYDLGAILERLPAIAPADQDLPPLRLALHDWVVAWDRRTGHAWLGGRALDGDGRRLARRLDDVHARLTTPAAAPRRPTGGDAPRDRSSSARASTGAAYEAGVERIREHIADGDIYQANLTRRLETPFDGDPWQLYRRLRTGDPSLFSAYLDLGAGPADRPAAGAPVGVAGAVPVGRRRRASSRPIRSRAPARAAATPRPTGRSRASCCRAPRTAPRT